jgi:hypothetical protein
MSAPLKNQSPGVGEPGQRQQTSEVQATTMQRPCNPTLLPRLRHTGLKRDEFRRKDRHLNPKQTQTGGE